MKIAVVGGAGFIGSHIVDRLLERQHEVLVVDDLSTGQQRNLPNHPRVTLSVEDICGEAAATALERFSPEVVIHHAAQMNVRRSVTEPVFDTQVNVLGTVSLLEASRRIGVRQFIFASSGGAIYGEQSVFPAPEGHETHPASAYGVAKLSGEHYIEYFCRLYGMHGVALRYGNVYGPRQNPKGEAGVVAIFAERVLAGRPLVVNGDGLQTRDFVFVSDVVAANLAVLENPPPASSGVGGCGGSFAAYNIGTGKETSVLDIVEAVKEHLRQSGGQVDVTFGPALAGEQRRSVVDPSLIGSLFGWQAKVTLVDGIAETMKSFSGAVN